MVRKMRKNTSIHNIHKIKQMKKQTVYTAPIVEIEMIDVEMGIASSVIMDDVFFDEENVEW